MALAPLAAHARSHPTKGREMGRAHGVAVIWVSAFVEQHLHGAQAPAARGDHESSEVILRGRNIAIEVGQRSAFWWVGGKGKGSCEAPCSAELGQIRGLVQSTGTRGCSPPFNVAQLFPSREAHMVLPQTAQGGPLADEPSLGASLTSSSIETARASVLITLCTSSALSAATASRNAWFPVSAADAAAMLQRPAHATAASQPAAVRA